MFIQDHMVKQLVKHQKHNSGRTNMPRWDTQIKNCITTDKITNKTDKKPMQTQWRK